MKRKTTKIRRHTNKLFRQHRVIIIVLIAFVAVGSYWLFGVHAATPFTSINASTGNTTGVASALPNTAASNGSDVEFGANITLNPTVGALIGHLDDTQWNLQDRTNGYTDISVDITPVVAIATNQGYYYANTFYFNDYTGSNLGLGYAGIQTNGSSNGVVVGNLAVFSIWGATSGITEPGGTSNTFSEENEPGFSVHLPYAWVSGDTYKLDIYLDSTNASTELSLWTAKITNLQTNTTQLIGSLYVPTSWGNIYGPVTFHERYFGPATGCSDLTSSVVSFTNMEANNGTDVATAWDHYNEANDPACAPNIWIKDLPTGYTSAVGAPPPN